MANPLRLLSPAGRAHRAEFIAVTVAVVCVELAGLGVLHELMGLGSVRADAPYAYAATLPVVGWLLLTVVIRRLHDLGRTGGLLLVALLVELALIWLSAAPGIGAGAPLGWTAGGLALAAWGLLAWRKGDPGPNRYDRQPKRNAVSVERAVAAGQRLRRQMQTMALPTLLFRPATTPVFSKLGGKPELPKSMAWPQGLNSARIFIAQLDLAEVRAGGGPGWLPDRGRVYVFLDEDGWDSLQLLTCIVSQATPGRPRNAPAGYEPDPFYGERRVAFRKLASIPSLDWLAGPDVDHLSPADFDELTDAPDKPFGEGPQHRIGGYPSEIQGVQMALECEFRATGVAENYRQVPLAVWEGAKDWRLLLQIDSDAELGMNWIDSGRLYVFIREQDARAGDFSKTTTLCQFH